MMYSRQAHQHTVQLNSAIFKAGYFYGKTVLRLGFLFDRLLRRRLKEKLIFETFQRAADCLLTNLQKINTIYVQHFSKQNVPVIILNSFRDDLSLIAKEKTRSLQLTKFLELYLINKQVETHFKYLAKQCSKTDLVTHCRRIREKGDTELIEYERNFYSNGDLTNFIEEVRKHYEKKFLLELLKNYSLRETIRSMTGVELEERDISRYQIILDDHVMFLGTEVTLKYATEQFDILCLIKKKYDFEVAQKRSQLIHKFIEAIKRRKQNRIAEIYDEYHQVILKNKELLNKFRDSIVIDYMKNLKAN